MTARAPSLRRVDAALVADSERFADALTSFLTDTSNAIGGQLAFGNMRVLQYVVDVTMPEAWTAPTLTSPWANAGGSYAPSGYSKNAEGYVSLRGRLTGGTYGTTAIFTLPAGYRPAYDCTFPAAQSSAATPAGQVNVNADGKVIAPQIAGVQSGTSTYLSLDGVVFQASDPTPPTLGAPFPVLLSTGNLGNDLNVTVFGCEDWTGRAATATPYPRIAWTSTGTAIAVTGFAGLSAGRRYKVRIAIFGQ